MRKTRFIIHLLLEIPPYLAGVGTAVEPSTQHVISDVVAINFWLLTSFMRNQPHSSLLKTRITCSFCQIKHTLRLIMLQESGLVLR